MMPAKTTFTSEHKRKAFSNIQERVGPQPTFVKISKITFTYFYMSKYILNRLIRYLFKDSISKYTYAQTQLNNLASNIFLNEVKSRLEAKNSRH